MIQPINNIAFKQKFSYESFITKLSETGVSSDLSSQCIKSNQLGSGANSVVYRFTDERLKNWAIKIITKYNDFQSGFLEPITKLFDEFGNINLGQEIAKIGERVRILKRIDGNPHSVPDWSIRRRNKTPISQEEVLKFNNDLKQISEFPQETFDDYAKKLFVLNEKGYKADSFNPNNYLVNTEKQEIHIIDAYKYEPDSNQNTVYDLFCPLCDYPNFEEYYNKTPDDKKLELLNFIHTIFQKCIVSAQKIGLSTDENIFMTFIAKIDSRENNGNMYSGCYNKFMISTEHLQKCIETLEKSYDNDVKNLKKVIENE